MAIDTKRLAGIATLTVDGKNYLLRGELTYSVSNVMRETIVGQDRVHGYSEKPHSGFVSATLSDSAGLSVADFNAMSNVTVVAELANGKTVVGRNMWSIDAQEVDTAEGKISIRWEGESVEEA